jgi:hypothetical protein
VGHTSQRSSSAPAKDHDLQCRQSRSNGPEEEEEERSSDASSPSPPAADQAFGDEEEDEGGYLGPSGDVSEPLDPSQSIAEVVDVSVLILIEH